MVADERGVFVALTKFHAISGLPRSGSTLLSAILRQNPRFSAGIVSPVYTLAIAMLDQMNQAREFSSFLDDDRRRSLLRSVFHACYCAAPPAGVVFDTNRMWTGKAALLREIYPRLKIVCCVRDIGWILDSIERMLRRNPLQTSKLFEFKSGVSFYARIQALMHTDYGNIGLALGALREAWYSEDADMLVVVRYESLVRDPKSVLARLYDELGEAPFEHTFERIEFDEPEYDALLGMPGLHKVASRVEELNREPVIPPEIFARYADLSFWMRPQDNVRNVTVL